MDNLGLIKLTVMFEKQWWVGIFEKIDITGYSVAREVFGSEPTDPEVYQFVIKNIDGLKFSRPTEENYEIKKINPKRMLREAKKEQSKLSVMTKAYDVLRIEMEKNKKQKKVVSAREKELQKQIKYELKQSKRKEKHRGH